MKSVAFVIPGQPVGYVSKPSHHGSEAQRKKATKYHDYCEKVRLLARQAGLTLPLIATKAKPLIIHVIAYFEDGRHADPENCRKGIVDSLFYVRKDARKFLPKGNTNDKHVGGSHFMPLYDPVFPRAEITIEFWDRGPFLKEFLDGACV